MKENIKIIGIIIICIICIIVYGGLLFLNYSLKSERPNELCKEMKEISDNQILIGLSKEEVEEILGEPGYKFDNETGDVYAYNVGTLDRGLFLGDTAILFDCSYVCDLRISFDENDKVKHTSIHTGA